MTIRNIFSLHGKLYYSAGLFCAFVVFNEAKQKNTKPKIVLGQSLTIPELLLGELVVVSQSQHYLPGHQMNNIQVEICEGQHYLPVIS